MFTCTEIAVNDFGEWNSLIGKSETATFFQTKDWLSLWTKHFGKNTKIFEVKENEEVIGILPIVKNERTEFLGTGPVLGSELVSDYGDIIASAGKEKAVWETFITFIRKEKKETEFDFHFVREDSPSFSILRNLGGIETKEETAPFITLPKTWDEYLTNLNRHDRHELRRKMRKLEETGASLICDEGEESGAAEFFRLMALSDPDKKKFLKNEMKIFFSEILDVFVPKKEASLCFLKFEEKNIAAVLLFHFNNKVLLYNSGFDPEYSYLSPSLILKALMIKKAIEEDKSEFDFLRGNERYKYDLGGRDRALYNVILK